MENITFPEIKLMVDLVKKGQSLISPKKIQEKIRKLWGKDVSLQQIYKALDLNFDEDFERESDKIKYYGNIHGTNIGIYTTS